MPELPEVETLRQGLEHYLIGHTIETVELRMAKQFQGDQKKVEGAKVVSIQRFGKGLVIILNNDYALAIHIKLTGQLIYRGPNQPKHIDISVTRVGEVPNNATRIIFHLDRKAMLYYNDMRQFGWIKVVRTDDVHSLPFFKELGPEFPLVKGEHQLTEQKFGLLLGKTRTAV
ncbi:MAG: hypothetical protein KGL95_08045, partial [Patescibacteria group bacterium]|nr:hypothetical protein [Patescibacteria group bacterium]